MPETMFAGGEVAGIGIFYKEVEVEWYSKLIDVDWKEDMDEN